MSKRSNLLTALSFAVAAAIFVAAPGAAFAQAPAPATPATPATPAKPQPQVMPKKAGAITPAERKKCQDQHTACMKAAAKRPDKTPKPADKKDMKDMKKGGITPAEKARCDQRMQACMKAAAKSPAHPKK